MPKMRLDKFFSVQELISRKDIKTVIKNGGIKINDGAAKNADEQVDTDCDRIFLYNKPVEYKPYIYIMLNKPKGVVSSTDDKINKTVLELVPKELFRSGLFPAGRLDKDSEGFVLLTNDGDFAHRMLSPKNHVEKVYEVRLDGWLTADGIKQLEAGVTLSSGEVCKAQRVNILEDSETPLAEVVLCEGRYHQIKRMFGVLDLGVNGLRRTRIGCLSLDYNLAPGECREIMHKELTEILAK